jgi:glycosyltransferase involved in cell wall biosynthesis
MKISAKEDDTREREDTQLHNRPKVAVLIPCYNEEIAITQVVQDFKETLPDAAVYVYDNNSKDETRSRALEAGAIVRTEKMQGKGNVVRRMFADIEADIYILVDGDDTYDAGAAPAMIQLLEQETLDMVNGARVTDLRQAYRPGHRLGNKVLTNLVQFLFGKQIDDMLSGYRAFSRRFVKSFPALSTGFEIETELTVHSLELRMPIAEVETYYKDRPEGSISKLNTYRDGFRILKTILMLLKEERPLLFFTWIFFILAMLSLGLAWPILIEYIQTGLVPRFPTAILSTGIMLLAFLSLFSGFILDTITHGRWETKRMAYLAIPRFKTHKNMH